MAQLRTMFLESQLKNDVILYLIVGVPLDILWFFWKSKVFCDLEYLKFESCFRRKKGPTICVLSKT